MVVFHLSCLGQLPQICQIPSVHCSCGKNSCKINWNARVYSHGFGAQYSQTSAAVLTENTFFG